MAIYGDGKHNENMEYVQNYVQPKENFMKKEFVPYDEALELKKIDFQEECIAYYAKMYPSEKYVLACVEQEDIDFNTTSHIEGDGCIAPMYQQVFKWFRDRGLYSEVNTVNTDLEPKFTFCISRFAVGITKRTDTASCIVFKSKPYSKYEDAQLDCLRELIEIFSLK